MSHHQTYRPDIDGLRAIAVISVVAFHAFPDVVRGGYVGVDVFFVISGYLITDIIARGLAAGRFSVVDFYVSRIRRILPALIVVLAACLAFGFTALFPDEFKQLAWHTVGAMGFLSNIILWFEAGYFDDGAITKPLLHLWSLGIEEQFYLAWPFIITVGYRSGVKLIWLVAAIAAVSFVSNVLFIGNHPSAVFYLPFSRAWELLIGAILALAPKSPQRPLFGRVYSASGALMLFIAITGYNQDTIFPGWAAALPTTGAALIIIGGPSNGIGQFLSNRAMTTVGRISYPLYLWHWPLLSFASIVNGGTPGTPIVCLLVLTSVVLAALTYLLVERPAQAAIRKVPRAALVPVLAIVGLGGMSWFVFGQDGMSYRPAVIQAEAQARQIGGALWAYGENDICRETYPSGWELFCVQSRRGSPTVMLVGNSYANHLYPGAVAAFPEETILNIGTCDPAEIGTDTTDCKLQDEIIAASPRLKLVILSSDWRWAESEAYSTALRKRIEWMTGRGVAVAVFGPKLSLPFHVRECIARPFRPIAVTCDFPADEIQRRQFIAEQSLIKAIGAHRHTSFFDQNPLFCDSVRCSVLRDGVPLLRDSGHYSEFGSIAVMAMFAAGGMP